MTQTSEKKLCSAMETVEARSDSVGRAGINLITFNGKNFIVTKD